MASGVTTPVRMLKSRRGQAILAQVLGAVALVVVAVVLATTLMDNLARLNLTTGFGFLWRPAGMQIGETIVPFQPTDSFAWAMVAAAVNTIRVALAAMALATVLGTAIGIMRLSGNPLLRTLTRFTSNCSAIRRCCCRSCSGPRSC